MKKLFNINLSAAVRFARSNTGNVAIITAISMPLIVGLVGGGIDYTNSAAAQAKLQTIADGAAIAAAREVSLANTKTWQIRAAAIASSKNEKKAANIKAAKFRTKVTVSKNNSTISVVVSRNVKPIFAQFFGTKKIRISAKAEAKIIGAGNICVMGLNKTKSHTIVLAKRSKLIGHGCGVFSSSAHRRSITVQNNAQINVDFICAAGGIRKAATSRVIPTGIPDCTTPQDPLAKRPLPVVSGCDYHNVKLKGFVGVLSPGVYCGGLSIVKGSNPRLEKGIYIIKDGPLLVASRSKLIGEGVGFFLTGTNASFKLFENTEIAIKAPETGPMAGILFFQDPRVPGVATENNEATMNVIRSAGARILEGTIYLPRGRLKIDASGSIAQESAYTVAVADRLIFNEGPTMVFNSDYAASKVPVPTGLAGGRVVLSQ